MKKLFIISLICNLFFISLIVFFLVKKGSIRYVEKKIFPQTFSSEKNKSPFAEKEENSYYTQRLSLFNLLPLSEKDIVLIGNSISIRNEWSEMMSNTYIKDRSINGVCTDGVLKRIDQLLKYKPKKIFLMIGINDLSKGIGVDSIAGNYLRIVKKVKFLSPETLLYIQSVLPVNDDFKLVGNEDIIQLNLFIKNLAHANDITYIDTFSYLLDSSGKLDKKFSNDGLHLLGEGFMVWKNIIAPYINSS